MKFGIPDLTSIYLQKNDKRFKKSNNFEQKASKRAFDKAFVSKSILQLDFLPRPSPQVTKFPRQTRPTRQKAQTPPSVSNSQDLQTQDGTSTELTSFVHPLSLPVRVRHPLQGVPRSTPRIRWHRRRRSSLRQPESAPDHAASSS